MSRAVSSGCRRSRGVSRRWVWRLALSLFAASLTWGAVDEANLLDPILGLDDLTVLDEHLRVEAPSRRWQHIALAPAAVYVLTDKDLDLSPAFTLPDRLRVVPGIDVYQHRHGQFDVGLRGFNGLTTPRTLATVDGRDFGFDELGALYWVGFLHPSDISRVEIVKGPVSVAYGANAFGGIIAISGRQVGDHPELHSLFQLGTDGFGEVDLTALCPILLADDGLRAYVKACAGATWRDDLPAVEGIPFYGDDPIARHTGETDLETWRYRLVAGVHLPGTSRAEVEAYGYRMPAWDLMDPYSGTVDFGHSVQHGVRGRIVGDWGEVSWLHDWSDGWWNTQFAAYWPWQDYQYNAAGFDNHRDDVRLQVNHPVGDHQLVAGGEFRRWHSRSNLWSAGGRPEDPGTWAGVTTRTLGVFAEDQWRPWERLGITYGARFDHDNRAGTHLSPRCAINLALSADEFLRLSWSRGYRLPAAIESYLQAYYFSSNLDLDPETINAVEAGWQRRFTDLGLTAVANASYSRSNDRIVMDPLDPFTMQANWMRWLRVPPFGPGPGPTPIPTQQPGPFFRFENRDNPLHLWGAEVELRQRCLVEGDDCLELWGNVTFQDFRYEDSIVYASPGFNDTWIYNRRIFAFYGDLGRDLDEPPRWKVNLGATWQHQGWFVGATLRYVHGRDALLLSDPDWLLLPWVTEQHIKRFCSLDLMVGRQDQLSWCDYTAKLGISDVFDATHTETAMRDPVALAIDEVQSYGAIIGRCVGLSLHCVLK